MHPETRSIVKSAKPHNGTGIRMGTIPVQKYMKIAGEEVG